MKFKTVRNINVHQLPYDNQAYRFNIHYIRRKVFVEEQKVRPEEEFDDFETVSNHYLAYFGVIKCGTARWRITKEGIKLERFAVLADYRNTGIGTALLTKVLADVKAEGGKKKIYLHAQVSAIKFYERAGFVKEGPLFSECNIDHYKMVYKG